MNRTEILSRQVERLCIALVAAELTLLAVGFATSGKSIGTGLLAAAWGIWLALQVRNYQLVRCGGHTLRFENSRRFVNRPEFPIRAAFHVLINWSAIAVALIFVWMSGLAADSDLYAWLCIAASVGAWVNFNLLHRRVNHARNLGLSSIFAVLLIGVSVQLLRMS